MKTFTVGEAQGKLAQLIAEAHRGENIVLTDGERTVMLEPRLPTDPEIDSPELEAELLKAASGPFTPYSPEEMREHCARMVRERQKRQ